ncbi:MAG: glycosyltransferase family 39 protein [Candidatus Niyogibacteria bacterium]|nr:glycosyltransferase family 39 protein [Candidatus Niyogibacteria bacterium]
MMKKPIPYALIAILVLAAVLRVSWIARGDTMNDEVFYGFRAIGPMDFDEATDQTTPWEWFDPRQNSSMENLGGQAGIPWWAHWSFHDHPPLVFWIQHFSIGLFGENNFALRFPSALFGVASVYLLCCLGRRLYSERVGLLTALILAVTLNHNYISRLGMQESYVIFFLFLGLYFFTRALQDDRYWLGVGAALGLGFLAKYNVLILAPILFTYLLLFRRDYFRKKNVWLGIVLALSLASPVIIYNAMLYRATGHFDFQLSYIVGQNPDVWKVAPGKEIGTLGERIANFIPRMIATNSWIFLALIVASLAGFLSRVLRNVRISPRTPLWESQKGVLGELFRRHAVLLISIVWLLALLAKIGPSYRFLTMLAPLLALIVALGIDACVPFFAERRRMGFAFAALLVGFELFYTVNNLIAYYPAGPAPWLSSKVRYENYNWGYNALGAYFKKELNGKMPALTFDVKYTFLDAMQNRFLQKARERAARPYPALIVTYGNFDRGAKLWVLDRLHMYHGWPVITLDTYVQYLRENGPDYYDRVGFKTQYFVFHTAIVPTPEFQALIRDLPYESIRNPRGEEVFRIYKRSATFDSN